jgi:hypothetical protein
MPPWGRIERNLNIKWCKSNKMKWLKWHEIKAQSIRGKLWYYFSDVIHWFRFQFACTLHTLDEWAVRRYNEELEREIKRKRWKC